MAEASQRQRYAITALAITALALTAFLTVSLASLTASLALPGTHYFVYTREALAKRTEIIATTDWVAMENGPTRATMDWDVLADAAAGGLKVDPTFGLPLPPAHQALSSDGSLDKVQLDQLWHCTSLLGACLGSVPTTQTDVALTHVQAFLSSRASGAAKRATAAGIPLRHPHLVIATICKLTTCAFTLDMHRCSQRSRNTRHH